MKVVLVTRCDRASIRRGGGIARSGVMLKSMIESFGGSVVVFSDKAAPETVDADTDVVWLYGDFAVIDRCCKAARSVGASFMYNSTFDTSRRRTEFIAATQKRLEAERGDVFAQVFTHHAAFNSKLASVPGGVVAIPKPLRTLQGPQVPFCDRTGVCVGEITKATTPRFAPGVSIEEVANRISGVGVKVFAYQQYGSAKAEIRNVTVLPPDHTNGFVRSLSKFRVFVSVVSNETFAMVPMEAASAGTPVLYRNMPQSLSEYLGHCGYAYRDVDDMVRTIGIVYNEEGVWNSLSRAGRLAAEAHGNDVMAGRLRLSLEYVASRRTRK